MPDLEFKALLFAITAHAGQVRKYTGERYVTHPVAVAEIVKTVTSDEEVIAAALLHDVVEDCGVTVAELEQGFGPRVAELVGYLSDVSRPSDGNRAKRKALDRAHSASASAEAQTVKLADLLDNCQDIVAHDRDFAKVYLNEMRLLLGVLTKGDPVLLERARDAVVISELLLAAN